MQVEKNGFTFSLCLEEDLLHIEALHQLLKRKWEANVTELAFCNGTTTLTTLGAGKLFDLLSGEETGRCEIIYPLEADIILSIELRVSFPFIGVVSADILFNEKSGNDIERLEKSITELGKYTALFHSAYTKTNLLEAELRETKQEIAVLKKELSLLNVSMMEKSAVKLSALQNRIDSIDSRAKVGIYDVADGNDLISSRDFFASPSEILNIIGLLKVGKTSGSITVSAGGKCVSGNFTQFGCSLNLSINHCLHVAEDHGSKFSAVLCEKVIVLGFSPGYPEIRTIIEPLAKYVKEYGF